MMATGFYKIYTIREYHAHKAEQQSTSITIAKLVDKQSTEHDRNLPMRASNKNNISPVVKFE